MKTKRYLTCAETAKEVRKALKENFAGIKFSVISRHSSSVYIKWTDGPTANAVQRVTSKFEGATFDSSTDLKGYQTGTLNGEVVRFGADFINTERLLSVEFLTSITTQFCDRRHEKDVPEIKTAHDGDAYVEEDPRDYHSVPNYIMRLARETDAKDLDKLFAKEDAERAQYRAAIEAAAVKVETKEASESLLPISYVQRPENQQAIRESHYHIKSVGGIYEIWDTNEGRRVDTCIFRLEAEETILRLTVNERSEQGVYLKDASKKPETSQEQPATLSEIIESSEEAPERESKLTMEDMDARAIKSVQHRVIWAHQDIREATGKIRELIKDLPIDKALWEQISEHLADAQSHLGNTLDRLPGQKYLASAVRADWQKWMEKESGM